MKNRRLLILYVALIDVAALIAVATLPATRLLEQPGMLAVLAVVTGIAGSYPVRLSMLRVQMSVGHPFVLCALAALGPFAAVVTAVSGAVGALLHKKASSAPMRVSFNLGAQALSVSLAGWVFLLLGGTPGGPLLAVLGPLAAAAATFFLGNTGLVSVAVALEKSQPWLRTWRESFLWTTVTYVTGMVFAVSMLALLEQMGFLGLALGIPPCWLLIVFYRMHKARLEEQQRRIREVEAVNVELENKVAERTRELQDALAHVADANRQLRETDQLKETLTQTLVHDLKNPLTSILGSLQILERQVSGNTLRLVSRCKHSSARIQRMILDLLDIAGLEEGRFKLQLERFDAVELIRRALDDMDVEARARKVQFLLEAPDGRSEISGDLSVLRRVVDNLLSNALRHSPDNGTVTLHVEAGAETIEIGVADQGPGIPEEYREKVFEKFARLELRDHGVSTNRGLGLTFCRLAVEAHDGRIRVEAGPGGGALFRISLPGRWIPTAPEAVEFSTVEDLPAEERAVVQEPGTPGSLIH